MDRTEAERIARETLATMEQYYKDKYLMAAEELEGKHRQALREHQDKLHEIYERNTAELTEDYKGFVGKVGVIAGLVGILIGMAMATLIEIVFK